MSSGVVRTIFRSVEDCRRRCGRNKEDRTAALLLLQEEEEAVDGGGENGAKFSLVRVNRSPLRGDDDDDNDGVSPYACCSNIHKIKNNSRDGRLIRQECPDVVCFILRGVQT